MAGSSPALKRGKYTNFLLRNEWHSDIHGVEHRNVARATAVTLFDPDQIYLDNSTGSSCL